MHIAKKRLAFGQLNKSNAANAIKFIFLTIYWQSYSHLIQQGSVWQMLVYVATQISYLNLIISYPPKIWAQWPCFRRISAKFNLLTFLLKSENRSSLAALDRYFMLLELLPSWFSRKKEINIFSCPGQLNR